MSNTKKQALSISLGMDTNGNKVVKISCSGKGFSIQTNGNLPNTHCGDVVYINEIKEYVSQYGTERQRKIMDLFK